MAYNILKGTVEFTGENGSLENTVDLQSNQTIGGNKIFSQTLSASAITTDAGAIVPPAITAIGSDGANRVITSDGDGTATAQTNVTISNNSLTASFFSGSGIGLSDVRAQSIINSLSASQIHISNGLAASNYSIIVSASHGINVSAGGVSVDIEAQGGLQISSSLGTGGVAVDPTNALDITTGGQSLADADIFIAHDASRGKIVAADALDIYNYINGKISSPAITSYTSAGDNRIVTSVNSSTVNAEENLTFDGSKLSSIGQISASLGITGSSLHSEALTVDGVAQITGSVEISGPSTTLLKLFKGASNTREIEIFSGGSRQSAITLNASEQLFIENESTKDIVLRTNNQNTLRVFGQNQRVGIAKEGVTANAELDVDGSAIISGSLTVSGSARSHYKVISNASSANYNIAASDNVVIFNVTGAFTATLPLINSENHGVQYYVKSIGAGAVTITGSAGAEQLIDSQLTKICNQGDSAKLMGYALSTGYDWAILSFLDNA